MLAILGFLSVAVVVALALGRCIFAALGAALAKWRRLGFAARVVSAVMVVIATVEAQKGEEKCSNEQMCDSLFSFQHSNIQTFNHYPPWRLEQVVTNDSFSYSMPSNAVRYPNWWMRGAYEDVFKLDFGDWSFPLGTASVSSLWVYTWGMIRSRLRGGYEIAAIVSPLSAVPQVSEFWHSTGTNGSKILTWHNFFLGRIPATSNIPTFEHSNTQTFEYSDIPTLLSAQLELFPNGDFIARSNLVERSYKRVNPDDWDDDGIPNDIDEEPYSSDGENFGPSGELPDGANQDNYCWVEVVVPNANSLVTFTGDGPSNLSDPRFIAKAGTSHRVNLLIGKTYDVVSAQPIFCTAKSSEEIVVSGDGDRTMTVVWPVSYEIVTLARSASRQVRMIPPQLTGTIQWSTNTCPCHAGIDAESFDLPVCNGACSCYICNTGGFTFNYEGYSLSFEGVECDCHPDIPEEDEGPYAASASVSFSKKAVIFEDAYMNTPTELVPKKSTRTTLSCVAHGGPNGGRAVFSLANGEKLSRISGVDLPIEVDVPSGHKVAFEIVYKGSEASGSEDDIVATARFTDNEEGEIAETTDEMTVVEVELRAVKTAAENHDNNRHVYGIAEDINYIHRPSSVSVVWSFPESFIERGEGFVMCPWEVDDLSGEFSASISGVVHRFDYAVLEPQIEARNPRVNPSGLGFSPVAGEAGHLLLYHDMYVVPAFVSFDGIEIREAPDESQSCPHSGYYDDRIKGGNWSHTANDGAGVWNRVQSTGLYGIDRAGRGGKYEEPLSDGWKEWAIPMEWGIQGLTFGRFDTNPTTQRFVLHANGTFQIMKFGNVGMRSKEGFLWLNGKPSM